MSSDWAPVTLGTVLRVRHGHAFKSKFTTEKPTDYALFTLKNVCPGGGFREESPRYYDGPVEDRFVLGGDEVMVVLTDLSRGGDLLGFPARVPQTAGVAYLHNQRVGRIEILDSQSLSERFAYWLLCSPSYRSHVLTTATQTTVLDSAPSRIEAFEFLLPPVDEQQRIAGVLDALNDKIEHNSLLARRLADTALTRFESRRVRWRKHGSLGEIGAPIREASRGDLPYVGLEHMPRGSTILNEWVEAAAIANSNGFRRGDVLFGKLRPYFKKVGVAPVEGRCSTEILVLRPSSDHLWGPLLGYVSSDAFIAHCVQVSRGTKMPRAEWRDSSTFPIGIPDEAEAIELTREMRSLYEQAIALVYESKTLRAVRDALIPKLVSGAIRVQESYDPADVLGTLSEAAPATA